MRSTTFFGIIAVLTTSAALAACGSDTTSGSTGTGGSGDSTSSAGGATATSSSTTTTSSTTTGTSTSSASTSSGTGGAGPSLVNRCDPTALVDRTKDATVEITFGEAVGYKYAPPCIKVKSGTMVTFKGSTLAHPLAGGEVVNGAAMVDKQSPIKITSDAAPSVSFAISPAGSYPYFCTDHYAAGMQGLIVAE